MSGFLCAMVGASFVTAVAEVIRAKKGITAVGNAQIDTAQSKFGGASALFDGTGDYLTTDSASLAVGTGDFTFECWARASDTNAFMLFDQTTPTGSSNGYSIWLSVSTLNVYSGGWVLQTVGTITTNTWHHIAVTRSGSSLRGFIDGTQVGSTITTSNNISQTTLFMGAARIDTSTYDGNGYMDEIRISNNARYTTTFTPSTTPFVNDANTLLLIHADGTDASTYFEDDNGVRAPKGITALGNAQIDTAQSKFGGASALFDGTDDLIKTSIAETFSGDFTAECWFRPANTTTAYRALICLGDWTGTGVPYNLGQYGTNLFVAYYGVGNDIITSTAPIAANTWYHVALVRNGTTITLYLDGTSVGTKSNRSETLGNALGYSIGNLSGLSDDFNGHIDEVRISNTARYTATFTPSTTPFQNDANTLLLIHADGTDGSTVFIDDNGIGRSSRGIQASGNAQVDTAQSKFGGASLLLDGTGDYLTVNNSANTDFEFTAGEDYTLECWVRLATNNQFNVIISLASARSGNEYSLYIETVGANILATAATYGGSNLSRGTTSLSNNTWHHLAVSRSGTTVRLFVNGTLEDTDTHTFTAGQQSSIKIGAFADGNNGVNGHIDEVRISDIARYTASFTPSTTPFQNDANTLLLMHMDGTDASTVFIDDNGTRPV